jgi:hypothetical protein
VRLLRCDHQREPGFSVILEAAPPSEIVPDTIFTGLNEPDPFVAAPPSEIVPDTFFLRIK